MSDKTKAHLSAKTLWVLFILGLVNAVMYCFPYIRYVFYDQQIAAMGITNTQSGILMTIYAAANTITLIPGGILADKWSVKKMSSRLYSGLCSYRNYLCTYHEFCSSLRIMGWTWCVYNFLYSGQQ